VDSVPAERERIVVVVGSLNTDLVIGLDRMPDTGETVLGNSLSQVPGGKGLNQAVAAQRVGAKVAMIGAVGNDAFGRELLSVLEREGIEQSIAVADRCNTGTAIIELADNGENRIVVVPGANAQVDPTRVRDSLTALSERFEIGVVLVQGEIALDATASALEFARELGATTILNPAPMREFTKDILENVDYLVPNEFEARDLVSQSDMRLDSMLDCVEAANTILDLGVRNVIVTRGEKGAVWANANGSGQAAAFRIVPVDTVAAGDAFCGTFAAALNRSETFAEALRWASGAGALAATRTGAVDSLPNELEVRELLGLKN
jgi:ribokinase